MECIAYLRHHKTALFCKHTLLFVTDLLFKKKKKSRHIKIYKQIKMVVAVMLLFLPICSHFTFRFIPSLLCSILSVSLSAAIHLSIYLSYVCFFHLYCPWLATKHPNISVTRLRNNLSETGGRSIHVIHANIHS